MRANGRVRFGLAAMALCLAAAFPAGSAVAQAKITTAAVSWAPGNFIRVYSSDGTTVTERIFNGSNWVAGSFKAQGQAVSATAWHEGQQLRIRVYVTDGGKVVEHCWDGNGPWYIGGGGFN